MRASPSEPANLTDEHVPHVGAVVPWLLLLMGVVTLAPCVILPEWHAYQSLVIASQAEEHRVDALQQVVDRERRHLEALRSDQAVIDRLAQRELNLRRADEHVIRVALPWHPDERSGVAPVSTEPAQPFVPRPVQPPRFVSSFVSMLPAYDYDGVFCDDETRPIIMIMSVGLICLAVGLGARQRDGSISGVRREIREG